MGLILDTSVLIDAERRGLNVDEMLAALPGNGIELTAICAMSLMELAHGTIHLRTEASQRQAEEFLEDLRFASPVVTDEIAVRAGRLDGLLRQTVVTIGMIDVVIAATALVLEYGAATLNTKRFKAVANLDVVQF